MNADDVLDQAAQRQSSRVKCFTPTFPCLRISKFFEDLIDRQLQFLARSFERQICLQAEIDIESIKDTCCGWLPGYDLSD
jgi:hypothetical protein